MNKINDRWYRFSKILIRLMVCIYFLLSFSTSVFSQNWLWAKSVNGAAFIADEGYSVSADANGNVFVTGDFNSGSITFGSVTLIRASGGFTACDVFIAKYDASGNALWAKSAGGPGGFSGGTNIGYSVSADASGNAFVTGYFSGSPLTFGTIILSKTGSAFDIFIAKYDSNGNILWAKNAGGANDDKGYSVSADPIGNVFVTGSFKSPTISFGTIILTNMNVNFADIFIAKYDASGNILWAKNIGGTDNDEGSSVSADLGGNIFVTGYFQSPTITFGTTILTNAAISKTDIFITKYDASGNLLWVNNAGGTGNDGGFSVSRDPVGSVFLTGYFDSPGISFSSITLTSVGAKDMFITKYDAGGNVLWVKSGGGIGIDVGYSVSADANGNVFVGGAFTNTTTITFDATTLTPPVGSVDPIFILKYDVNGNLLCTSILASGGDDAFGISADPFGNAFIEADFGMSPFTVGSSSMVRTGASIENIFVAKYTCVSNTLTASASPTSPLCNGQCNGKSTVTAFGGTSPYKYNWSSGQTTQTVTGLCVGNYTVIVTDALSAMVTATVSITQPTVLTVSLTATSLTCFENNSGTATAIPMFGTSPYSYSWNNTKTESPINNLSAGNYTVTATDKNGCTVIGSVIVTQPTAISTSVTATVSQCFQSDGSATIIASGGTGSYTYAWSNGATTPIATGLVSAIYQFTVTDANGCTKTDNIQISNFPGVTAQIISSTPVTCFGLFNGALTIDGTGGVTPYSFKWSNGFTTNTITGLSGGLFSATVTDGSGCTSSTSTTVSEPALLSATVVANNASCFGGNNGTANITASGGTGLFTYNWNPGGKTTSTIMNLGSGTYSITVTDSNGCTFFQTTSIIQPTELTATVTSTAATCGNNNGTANVTASGGTGLFTYNWNPGGKTTQGITGLATGTYSLTVTDANGCDLTQTISILNFNGPNAVISHTNILCNGLCTGIAFASGTGGTQPYIYSWTGGGQTTSVVTNLCAGTYTVVVTDINSCTSKGVVTITEPTVISITITSTPAKCTSASGTASANTSGGTSGYTYSWNNGQTLQTATGLTLGNYTLTVTDVNSCKQTQTVSVTQISVSTAAATANPATIIKGESIILNASGGGTYQWAPAGSLNCSTCVSPLATPTANTIYCVFVTDINSCTDSACIAITVEIPCEPLFIPNAFSPNDDGENDILFVIGNCIKKLELKIYDRWGEKVFETADPTQGWDGSYIGKAENTAMFTYYISATLSNNEKITKTGNISLIK